MTKRQSVLRRSSEETGFFEPYASDARSIGQAAAGKRSSQRGRQRGSPKRLDLRTVAAGGRGMVLLLAAAAHADPGFAGRRLGIAPATGPPAARTEFRAGSRPRRHPLRRNRRYQPADWPPAPTRPPAKPADSRLLSKRCACLEKPAVRATGRPARPFYQV